MTRELLELNAARLDDDLSFRVMAASIGVSKATLINALHRTATPNERTLHKIRRFLDARRTNKPRRRTA